MQITKIYIKAYKNLREFHWELNEASPVSVIVGKNASGKTNLLAALIHIFGQAFAYIRSDAAIKSDFDFSISYTKDYKGDETLLTFKCENNKHSFFQNDDPAQAIKERSALPEKIFTYYAGEAQTFPNIIGQYRAFELFTYLYTRDNHFILLSLFGSRLSSIKEDILDKQFKIKALQSVVITIQNPYTKRRQRNEKPSEENFWGAPAGLFSFFKQLKEVSEKQSREHVFDNAKLSLTITKAGLDKLMEDMYEYDLFQKLQQSAGLGFIRQIDQFLFTREGVEHPIGFDDLSEGERQRIGLLGAFAVYQGKETLFLLDEPDAFAHPRWQWDFVPDIQKAIGDTASQQVIFTTHSPIVVSSLSNPAFMLQDGGIREMNATFGNTINETLAEQDVPYRNGEVADKLKLYLVYIQDGEAQTEEAKALRAFLEEKLGTNHKELENANILISLYE